MRETRAQGVERRQSIRIKARLRCEIGIDGTWIPGQILDVSEGGLSLRGDIEVDQGENLGVRVCPPGVDPIEIKAIVWHSRRLRSSAGKIVSVCGTMLAEPTSAWTDWIRGAVEATKRETVRKMVALDPEPKGEAAPVRSAKQVETAAPDQPEAAAEGRLVSYRIRVKSLTGPRTRTLTLSAMTEAEARTLVEENLGSDWKLLEVYAA